MIRYHLSTLSFLLLAAALPAAAAENDPVAIERQIAETRLDPGRAVQVSGLRVDFGRAALRIEEGTVVPATPVAGRVAEMVFLGRARMVMRPPDDVEAGQLELFTGDAQLDEPVHEAVLVVARDEATEALLGRPLASSLPAAIESRARELHAHWRGSPERRILGVDTALLLDALDEPGWGSFFAGWFASRRLGGFYYLVAPDDPEQVTLGQFVPLEVSARERRRLVRELRHEQRRGRLIGLSVDDLGQWDTWASSPLAGRGDDPSPGGRAFEPVHYELEATLRRGSLRLAGTARITLRPVVAGSRAVRLELHPALAVEAVRSGGVDLFYRQQGGEVLTLLPRPLPPGAEVEIEVVYAGELMERVDGRTWVLLDPTYWYPHAGTVDLATYDLTLRWPRKLDLMAAGERVAGGEGGGERWERRRLDIPTGAVSFEVGRYRKLHADAGHVRVTLALDAFSYPILRENRDQLLAALTDTLGFYEGIYGPYPLDTLEVVTVPRSFSQAMLGYVTLSSLMMGDGDPYFVLLGLEDPRTVIAHEMAHQWWGHMVGWWSYRDQWISEAMANYSALLYARRRLGGRVRFSIGPTSGWQEALLRSTPDGRTVESLGPLVLGERLISSRHPGTDVYTAIVYKKGAVVLDMLARLFGEDRFLQILAGVVAEVDHRPITTEELLGLVERLSGRSLDAFAEQFVFGTGLPEVHYRYRFEPLAEGRWRIVLEARQQAPFHFRYRVVELPGGDLDVERERVDELEVEESTLVVPVQIATWEHPATAGRDRAPGPVFLQAHTLLEGASTTVDFEVELEPERLWLDRGRTVFGRFFDETRHPRRTLLARARAAAAADRPAEAEELLRRALATSLPEPDRREAPLDDEVLESDRRLVAGRIRLALARLLLDQGRVEEAATELEEAEEGMDRPARLQLEEELTRLEARAALRGGDAERAFRLLRRAVLRKGEVDDPEGHLLLAIAARATGHPEELAEALEEARARGADVSRLEDPAR